jgi:hypothetical protein
MGYISHKDIYMYPILIKDNIILINTEVTRMAKSKSEMISKGKEKYVSSIRGLGGASAYYSCGEKGGMDVAICLNGLKRALDETDWSDRWATAMA